MHFVKTPLENSTIYLIDIFISAVSLKNRIDCRQNNESQACGKYQSGSQYKTKGILMPQTGVEISCPVGTSVRVPADGILRHVGPLDGFGIVVILEHADNYATVLAPLDPDSITASVGDALRRGDPLGRSGIPDEGKNPYLHVELRRNDKAVRPDRLLK